MDEDILSDIVPSNIVSRQVPLIILFYGATTDKVLQPSQGAEGESEYGDDAMDEDELVSEEEDQIVRHLYNASCSLLTI